MELVIIVLGLSIALSLLRLRARLLVLAAEVAAVVLVLTARLAGAVFDVLAPPLARALAHLAVRLGRSGARVTRTRVGPAVLAGCVWLGERVFDAAGAAHRTTHRIMHRTAPGQAPRGRAWGA